MATENSFPSSNEGDDESTAPFDAAEEAKAQPRVDTSVSITLKLSESLRKKIIAKAAEERMNLNDFGEALLADGLTRRAWDVIESGIQKQVDPNNHRQQQQQHHRNQNPQHRSNQGGGGHKSQHRKNNNNRRHRGGYDKRFSSGGSSHESSRYHAETRDPGHTEKAPVSESKATSGNKSEE